MKVAAVVPAYNEESRIGVVLNTLKCSTTIDEIIAVSDGSADNTYEAAKAVDGIKVINLPENLGKGGAMLAGAKSTDAEIIAFFDADLIGLTPEHVDALIRPVVEGSADMSIGIFQAGRKWTDWAQKIAPYISGQRALLRSKFLDVPGLNEVRFGVEIAIGRYARENGLQTIRVPFAGVTHPLKEEKLGFIPGAAARAKMYWEIMKLMRASRNADNMGKSSDQGIEGTNLP